jgi:hypothetical protein
MVLPILFSLYELTNFSTLLGHGPRKKTMNWIEARSLYFLKRQLKNRYITFSKHDSENEYKYKN